jgi:hypothetical protein
MNKDEDLFNYYMEIGAIEFAGVDKDGEIIFSITEGAEDTAPELYKAHADFVDNALIDLYNKDLISIEYNENLEATITLTEQAKKIITEKGIMPLDEE